MMRDLEEENPGLFSQSKGSFAIEVNTYAMDRQLFFNPGIQEEILWKIQ